MCVEILQDNDSKESGIKEEFYVRRDGKWVQITEEEFNDLLYPKSVLRRKTMTDIEKVWYCFDRYEELMEGIINVIKEDGDDPSNAVQTLKEIRNLRKVIEDHLKLDI